MRVLRTELPGVLLLEPRVFRDARGRFVESWRAERYAAHHLPQEFVQDNLSSSVRGVVRGLHLQHPRGQGKLISVAAGEIFDVAVDVRSGSPTFGRWVGERLSAETHRQLYIPPGYAHGFQALSEETVVCYKCTDYYTPEAELTVAWNDPDIAVQWPLLDGAIVSARDAAGRRLSEIPPESLPRWEDEAT